ncbi:hypothetical protein KL918_002859 [Ogataea parapolymorpha]|uniref:UBX domain-containing protein n=1 Tax=Ogataea parapolymorpha (strain ATCC 26012 / BCRC 20466 / JCM 22074 / NRRL Y-7560 / DL-1) TaxID=871575 RepID=W1QGK9_OGAPD|nr:hypothetical protein HPODL_00617 [Ogataea parapolymorpha DL-1]ESX01218.1 hypothetical protein HPODL_00617 [Ogataea parapolymorpha DL-1]KAG7867420.1 hypothetical protein KL918_002859 [Ogataea parapolymorpha]KAG7871806.1 hypothetical protein KL916_003656 [Ogataea parapolymorpha]
MSSLTVSYNFRTFKCKVSPSKILNDVLIESCAHFKLEPSQHVLKHGNQLLDLSLPLRLANLPQGCKLELVKAPQDTKSTGGGSVVIKLQIMAPEGDSTFVLPPPSQLVKECDSDKSIEEVLQEFEKSLNIQLLHREAIGECKYIYEPIVQSMSKTMTGTSELKHSLRSLGLVTGNHTLRLRFKAEKHEISQPHPTMPPASVEHKSETQSSEQRPALSEETPSPVATSNPIQVYVPKSEHNEDEHVDESVYDMSIEQARLYQSLLAKRAHPNKQMMSKRQREQLAPEKPAVEECVIRVKFPDYTQVQLVLQPDHTLGDLYNVLSTKIVHMTQAQREKPRPAFQLHTAYPGQAILTSTDDFEKELVKDCQFAHRSLLVYRDDFKRSQYVKDEYLKAAKGLDELEEVKISKKEVETTQSETSKASTPPKDETPAPTPTTAHNTRKVPKWFKMGKK